MQRSRRGGGGSRSGGGGLFGARKPAPPAAPKRKPAPAPAAQPPARMQAQPPAQQSGGMLSGIGSTIAQGMAFGTGSAIAHRAVGAVANSVGGSDEAAAPVEQEQLQPVQQMGQQQLTGACAMDKEMFFDCLKVNQGDQQACSFLYDQLKSCQQNETTFG